MRWRVHMRVPPGRWQWDIIGLVQIKIAPWRHKGMMWIRERAEKKERCVWLGSSVLLQVVHCLLGDVRGGVQFLRHARAPGLWDVQGTPGRQGIVRTTQASELRVACCQPLLVVAPDVIAMANGQEHVVKAVIGARQVDMPLLLPT